VYYEDFEINRTYDVGQRTVTDQDVDRFVELSGLDNPIFLSDQGARQVGHPARLAPGPLQLSLAMGLCQQAGLFDRVVAVAQFDQLRFHRPVHPGDTLTMTAQVLSKRPVADPGRGLVVLRYQLVNQRQEPTLTANGIYIFQARPGQSG